MSFNLFDSLGTVADIAGAGGRTPAAGAGGKAAGVKVSQ